MLIFVIASVLAYELSYLKSCLDLVKWKIDTNEENFDKILALSTLNPEKHLDKLIGEMLLNCANSMNEQLKAQISNKVDLFSLDYLVPFPLNRYTKDEELELSKDQEEILKILEEYASTLDSTDYSVYFLAVSFIFVIILVAFKKVPNMLKSQKFFKQD